MFFRHKVSLATISILAVLGASGIVLAQQQLSVKIEPAQIDENVNPGQTLNETIKVTNQDQQPKTFYLLARDISGTGDGGQPVFASGTDDIYGMSAWVSFGQPSVVVAGGASKDVPFSIKVPKDAAPGGHFGAVFLSLEAKKPTNTGTGVGLEIGPIIDLRVAGEVVEDARIREFSTDKSIYGVPIVNFSTKIENLGNVLLKPHGLLEIVNMFGKKVFSSTINDSASGIYPKSQRSFSAQWAPEGFTFGRYQATEAWLYGENGNKTIYQTISFWVFPLNVILPVFFGILAVILAFYFGIRAYIAKKLRELQRGAGKVDPSGARSAPSKLLFVTLGFIVFSLVLLVILFVLFS